MKRANLFTVTETNKIKGVKDRRNILPLGKIRERMAYDPATGAFTYRVDCAVGSAGDDAVWRCRRTDNVGTQYESTRYWELVKFDENHWYDPRRLAYYFVAGTWPPTDTWVASVDKFDYSADNLQLMATGVLPASSMSPKAPASQRKPLLGTEPEPQPPKKGILARLFRL